VLFATDGTYGWLQLHTGYRQGSLLDGGWILFYLLFGAAALHPSMAVATEPTAPRVRLTRTRLAVLAVATSVAPVTGLLGKTTTSDRVVIAGSAIIVFGLVLLRMVGLVQRQEAEVGRARALEETTARLQELDRLKDQFVATVSHELRTPLTSIHGYLELVLDGAAGSIADEQRQFLSVVARNTERLRRLVDDLLLVSEIDAGNLELHLVDLDLEDLARASLESSRPRAEAGGVSLVFSANGPVRLTGDHVRISQLLDNVVSNALKFTPRGGSVSVRTSRSNGSAVVEVEDTGIGIPLDEQAQLFDRFFRARAAAEGAIQGTGLGLSISRDIAQAHGGSIDVTSVEDVGTTFRVALPAND
jgi:signal transduction histidine kinase